MRQVNCDAMRGRHLDCQRDGERVDFYRDAGGAAVFQVTFA
jgi:hypothetical protein